jgi:hypothetical protein
MKTESEIDAKRSEIVSAVQEFRDHFDLPTHGTLIEPEQHWLMALGALAFANWLMELPRPDNLGKLIEAMTETNINKRKETPDHAADNQSQTEK